MRGDATITVEVDVTGIDLPGLHGFVEWLENRATPEDGRAFGGLADQLHQSVNANPGCGSRVTAVAWTPAGETR